MLLEVYQIKLLLTEEKGVWGATCPSLKILDNSILWKLYVSKLFGS